MQTIADFPNLRGSEKLGDSCPCGCGGVKFLPIQPKARTLAVALPCQGCGASRVYEAGRSKKEHRQKCVRCAARAAWRERDQSVKPGDAFRDPLRAVLDRKGMTMGGLCCCWYSPQQHISMGPWNPGPLPPEARTTCGSARHP